MNHLEPAPFSQMSQIKKLMGDILLRRITSYIDLEKRDVVIKTMIAIMLSNNFFMYRSNAETDELWAKIRKEDEFVTFLMRVTVDFITALDLSPVKFNDYVAVLANTYNSLRGSDNESSIDDDLFERMPVNVVSLYKNNPWLVTLLTLDQLHYMEFTNVRNG